MGEAVGIDLGAAVAAAVHRRRSAWSKEVEVAVIGGAGWLAEVAVGITDLTGLPAVVPRTRS